MTDGWGILAGAIGLWVMAAGATVAQVQLTAQTSSPGNAPHLSVTHLAEVTAQAGLATIQVEEGQTSTLSIVRLAQGEIDIASSPTVLFAQLFEGTGPFSSIGEDGAALAENIRAIAPYNAGAYGLFALRASGIDSYDDLAGKTVWNGPPRGAALAGGRETIRFASGGLRDRFDYIGLQTNWGQLPAILTDGSVDAWIAPITAPSERVITALSLGEVNIISVPKSVFEGDEMTAYLAQPGQVAVTIAETDMGYGPEAGVRLISEDGVFRGPGLPFATFVRADLDFELVKAITARYVATLHELQARAPYGRTVNFDKVDAETTGFCGALTLRYHPGAVAAWEEAGYDIPDCAQ